MQLAFLDGSGPADSSGQFVFRRLEKLLERSGIQASYGDLRARGNSTSPPPPTAQADERLLTLSKDAEILVLYCSAIGSATELPIGSELNRLPDEAQCDKALFLIGYGQDSIAGATAAPGSLAARFFGKTGLFHCIVLSGSPPSQESDGAETTTAELLDALPKFREALAWTRKGKQIRESLALAAIYAEAPLAATAF